MSQSGQTFTITYNAHEARITPKLPELSAEALSTLLSYEPKGAEWSPFHKRNQFSTFNGKRTFNKQAHWDGRVSLFKKGRSTYNHFPTGLLPRVNEYFSRQGNKFTVNYVQEMTSVKPDNTRTLNGKTVSLKGHQVTLKLADHQVKVVEGLLAHTRGLAESPTASGKSIIISEIIYKFPEASVLLTVPSKSLLHQTAADLEGMLGEPVGRWGDNKKDLKRVTVAIIDSVHAGLKDEENVKYLNQIQVWVSDESHLSATDRYKNVSEHLVNAYIRYGVSATLRREDGAELVFHGLFGEINVRVMPMELIDNKWLVRPKIEMHVVEHAYEHSPEETGRKKPYWDHVYETCIVKSENRNQLILEQCKRVVEENRLPCLILISDLEHGEILQEIISYLAPCGFLQGEDKQKVRDQVVEKFCSLEVPFLVASTIFDIGVDIPAIRSVILAGAGKSASRAIQRVGRGLRKDTRPIAGLKPKDEVLIIDFEDRAKYFLWDHSRERQWWYDLFYPNCRTSWKNGKQLKDFDLL